ncbi:substrate-binding periplasmic protein [Neptuniibacter halophilus]|uniref:substrate-binding periplasmic protein n=1 Tax=Neptuniibacter halophilus TaxID=651666 RepID=UPI0025723B92|nr:transporter substrate-binding domain-containing protein [Neptuniibacter halophilus]
MAGLARQVVAALVLLLGFSNAFGCELVMGYRTSERLPLIDQAPDNRGLYFDLYNEAARQIGCNLKVSRLPKKRVIQGMRSGVIDFYPGFSFNEVRAGYAVFIENGLETKISILSSDRLAEVTELSQMQGRRLIVANGGPTFGAERYGIPVTFIENLDLDRAIAMIDEGRADFYLYHRDTLLYYLKKHPQSGVRIHPCCGESRPMYLGFSRASAHFQPVANPDYNPALPVSADNPDIIPAQGSVAARFAEAIQVLKQSGYVADLVAHYYE